MRPRLVCTTQPPAVTLGSATIRVGASRPRDCASASASPPSNSKSDGCKWSVTSAAPDANRNASRTNSSGDFRLLADLAANDSLRDGGGDRDGGLLPAPQPIGLGVVGLGDQLVERGDKRADTLRQLCFQRLLRGLLGRGATGGFGLFADLLGLLMRLLHDLRCFAADRFEILVGPVVHVLEVERHGLHRPAGELFGDTGFANDRGHGGLCANGGSVRAASVQDSSGDGGDFVLRGFDIAEPGRPAIVQPLAECLGDLGRHLRGDPFDERFVRANQGQDQDFGIDRFEHGVESGRVETGEVVDVERGKVEGRGLRIED